jgi:hypothetical protein
MRKIFHTIQKNQKQKVLFLANKRIPILFCLLVFLFLSDGLISREISELYISDNTAHPSVFFDSKGYTDIVHFKEKLIAVGTDGRIDCITKSGESAPLDSSYSYKLNCAYSNEEIIIAAGDRGIILYSSDGEHFREAESGTDKNISSFEYAQLSL